MRAAVGDPGAEGETAVARAARPAVVAEALRFGVVGTAGFLVDSAVLLAAMALGAGPYAGRLASYLFAATSTWALNRAWTFRDRAGGDGSGSAAWQWARFVAVNLAGFAANYGTYAALVATTPLVRAWPVLGVAAGALVGMAGNFLLSRRYVFRAAPAPAPAPAPGGGSAA